MMTLGVDVSTKVEYDKRTQVDELVQAEAIHTILVYSIIKK